MKPASAYGSLAAVLLTLAVPRAGATGISPSDFARIMPTPGLYRIDTDGASARLPSMGMRTELRRDGASGTETDRTIVNGTSSTTVHQGHGPVTRCVTLHNTSAPLTLPSACKMQSTSLIKDGLVHKAQCPHGSSTLTIQRLDSDTWEYRTEVVTTAGGGVPNPLSDPAMQRQMAAARASAAEVLKRQRLAVKSPGEVAALQAALSQLQGATPMRSRSRERWTRISDHCGAP
jgi:hypothetical protein